ncbi:MAG: hypothetical protein COV67_12095, partial [Nitrospinae bacterium CG11_big_fil_rev_8_21_14_0_20_56_8]
AFIGTPEYQQHKDKRFRAGDHPIIAENEAFLLTRPAVRKEYKVAFEATQTLYYKNQPGFDEMLSRIQEWVERL